MSLQHTDLAIPQNHAVQSRCGEVESQEGLSRRTIVIQGIHKDKVAAAYEPHC